MSSQERAAIDRAYYERLEMLSHTTILETQGQHRKGECSQVEPVRPEQIPKER